MNRCKEPGFIEVCRPDGRRGLWYRQTPSVTEADISVPPATVIELAAGREGDDDYFKLEPGHVVTEKDVRELQNIVLTLMLAFDMAKENENG